MANDRTDDDRTRKEGTYTKETEEVVRDEDGVHTKETYTKDDGGTTETTTSDTTTEDSATGLSGDTYDDDYDQTDDTYDADEDDDGHPGLLWFSAAGAIIMGLLWIIDITGLFGLTWTLLGATTTLVIAIIAAIGALLFWYDSAKSKDTATA